MGRPKNPTARLRALNRPSMLDIAWAAGIYEGEGYVNGPPRSRYLTTEVIQLVQKDRWILDKLAALFGGQVSLRKYKKPEQVKYNVFVWILTGCRARGFLMTIFTFLSPRRRTQVRGVLEPMNNELLRRQFEGGADERPAGDPVPSGDGGGGVLEG